LFESGELSPAATGGFHRRRPGDPVHSVKLSLVLPASDAPGFSSICTGHRHLLGRLACACQNLRVGQTLPFLPHVRVSPQNPFMPRKCKVPFLAIPMLGNVGSIVRIVPAIGRPGRRRFSHEFGRKGPGSV
jgi:hypothetical protein